MTVKQRCLSVGESLSPVNAAYPWHDGRKP